jgi:hypothetical protein
LIIYKTIVGNNLPEIWDYIVKFFTLENLGDYVLLVLGTFTNTLDTYARWYDDFRIFLGAKIPENQLHNNQLTIWLDDKLFTDFNIYFDTNITIILSYEVQTFQATFLIFLIVIRFMYVYLKHTQTVLAQLSMNRFYIPLIFIYYFFTRKKMKDGKYIVKFRYVDTADSRLTREQFVREYAKNIFHIDNDLLNKYDLKVTFKLDDLGLGFFKHWVLTAQFITKTKKEEIINNNTLINDDNLNMTKLEKANKIHNERLEEKTFLNDELLDPDDYK